jgi:hypothetical protein
MLVVDLERCKIFLSVYYLAQPSILLSASPCSLSVKHVIFKMILMLIEKERDGHEREIWKGEREKRERERERERERQRERFLGPKSSLEKNCISHLNLSRKIHK